MKTREFNDARVNLVKYLYALKLDKSVIDDITELAFRMTDGAVSDLSENVTNTIDNVKNNIGAFKWKLQNEYPNTKTPLK